MEATNKWRLGVHALVLLQPDHYAVDASVIWPPDRHLVSRIERWDDGEA